jgi:hypothetical protein
MHAVDQSMQNSALHKLFQSEQVIGHIGGRVTNSSSALVLLLLVAAFTAPALGQINATQLNETEWLNLGLGSFLPVNWGGCPVPAFLALLISASLDCFFWC